jgi:poly-gamma-glutamate synthesis protein (capsule biosynthesis protein)
MILVGDIGTPLATTGSLVSFLKDRKAEFGNKCFISNLEGLLSDRDPAKDNKPILSNHTSLPGLMKEVVNPVFCLANNHVLDIPGSFAPTVKTLEQEQIPFGGAGYSPEEALKPIIFQDGDQKVVLFNACWDFLLYNHKNPTSGVYVGEMDEHLMLKEVSRLSTLHPEALIVVYVHWNLDLEKLPFPMYRQFSRALVDAGAKIVAGTHAHCVQGGEKYKDGYIVYGLGNFFMPHHVFVGAELSYPQFANMQLALEWDPADGNVFCHWVEYQYKKGKHSLNYLGGERFEESEKLKDYSPFTGMSDQAYIAYYKKYRRKKILIPVYTDYRKVFRNKSYTRLLMCRASFARVLAKLKLISWQN